MLSCTLFVIFPSLRWYQGIKQTNELVLVAHTCNLSTFRDGRITRSRIPDQPGQHGETLSLLKIQKLARHGGTRLQSQLLERLRQENCLNWEVEVAVTHDCTTALQPGQQSKNVSKNKQTNKNPTIKKIYDYELKLFKKIKPLLLGDSKL